jgi:predicted nucleic acid-binding protein
MLKWGEINAQLQKIGKPMPIMDSLIASSCLAKRFVLITRNEKDFYSFEIEMINPF